MNGLYVGTYSVETIDGHLPSEGRVGFFEGREGKGKEGLVQKILLRRKNKGRCWY